MSAIQFLNARIDAGYPALYYLSFVQNEPDGGWCCRRGDSEIHLVSHLCWKIKRIECVPIRFGRVDNSEMNNERPVY